mgnify:CR=1 FL=1
MGRQKGFTASNRYSVEKEKLVVDELLAGKSFRTIRDETGISMEAIQRIKKRNNVVQPVKPKQKREKETKPREIYKARITSHVPLTHIRNGESYILNAF